MKLEEQFNQAVGEWREFCSQSHVQFSSQIRSRLMSEPYDKILAMGPSVLPLIKKEYEGENTEIGPAWISAVAQIVTNAGGQFEIPEGIRGRIRQMRSYTLNWLERNMQDYESITEFSKTNVYKS